MAGDDELRRRFDGVMTRLQAVCSALDLPKEDRTVVVDLGDLDTKCRYYQEHIEQVLRLPDAPEVTDELGELMIALSVSIQELKECCSDLNGPLRRLISALYKRLPDDPNHADDEG